MGTELSRIFGDLFLEAARGTELSPADDDHPGSGGHDDDHPGTHDDGNPGNGDECRGGLGLYRIGLRSSKLGLVGSSLVAHSRPWDPNALQMRPPCVAHVLIIDACICARALRKRMDCSS